MLRFHGSRDKQSFELVGHNSRLDELQAALLRLELPHLDAWCEGRRAAGRHYEEAGLGALVALPAPAAGADPPGTSTWSATSARTTWAPRCRRRASGRRATTAGPVHRQPAMRPWAPAAALPGTDEAARTHLAIPMSPVLSPEQAARVVAVARDAGLD